jgi:MFS family permease
VQPESRIVEIQAYAEGPPTQLDIAKGAPFGWWPAIIIALAAFIDRAEGAVTLGAAASLQEEFGFNDAFLGVLASAPIVASLLLVIPAGRLADRVKRKNMLVVVMCLWGVCTLGAGAAISLAMFTTFRILLGAATPLNIPPSSSLLGDFYPRQSRTKAFGTLRALENIGLPVGTLIGAVVGGLVGWRVAFFVVAVPALILAVVLAITLREPRRGVGDEISALTEGMVEDTPGQGASASGASVDAPGAAPSAPAVPMERVSGPQSSSVVAGVNTPPAAAPEASPAPPAPPVPEAPEHTPTVMDEMLTQGEFGPASMDAPPPGASGEVNTLGVWATFRAVFRIKTVRRLVFGQTVLFAAFAGFFAFGTLYFAREYFQTELLFSISGAEIVSGEAQAAAGILVAGLSIFAIGGSAVLAAKIDERYATSRPTLRVTAAVVALLAGFVALGIFVLVPALAVQVIAFLVFAGVNIIAVSNLSAAIADTLPARFRGSGFSAFQFLLAFGSAFGAAIVGVASALAGDDLRVGFAALLIPLIAGVIVVARARFTYVADAAAVVAEAGDRAADTAVIH